jgi:hypothetical protein
MPVAMTAISRALAILLGATVGWGCSSKDAPLASSSFPTPDGGFSPRTAPYFAPASRTLAPTAIFTQSGDVQAAGFLHGGVLRLSGNNASVTLDFGVEVGGLVTLAFGAASDTGQSVGLAFSESSQYVGQTSDASNGGQGADGALQAPVSPSGSYTVPTAKLRGGFRYLTLFLTSAGWVEIRAVSLQFTAAPAMGTPNLFPNYFESNDALLDQIWYAGAHTVELALIDPTEGRVWPAPTTGWDNSATVGVGTTVLVDGAKRDRTVWPGDMGISGPTAFVSLGDVLSLKNALSTLFAHQMASGELPQAGPEVNFYGSDTYHLWTLNGVYDYYLFSADKSWLDSVWTQYRSGLAFSTAKIDGNGLLAVTGPSDWGRSDQGGENIEANALLYRVLRGCSTLATIEGDSALATSCTNQAAALRMSASARLWDAAMGLFRDNAQSDIHPQDGNSLAVWSGLVGSSAQAQSIVAALKANWTVYGSTTPEWAGGISPFPGSLEVLARFTASDDQDALALIRTEWGYMLNAPIGTGSSFWEGYNSDGSFGYGGAYMSCSHGWSTGPTSALTMFVLGVMPGVPGAGAAYSVVPHPGDLTHAEGTLVLPQGQLVWVSWDHPSCGSFTLYVHGAVAAGSTGQVGIPTFGATQAIQLDGVTIWNGTTLLQTTAVASASLSDGYVVFDGLPPGDHTFAFTSSSCP